MNAEVKETNVPSAGVAIADVGRVLSSKLEYPEVRAKALEPHFQRPFPWWKRAMDVLGGTVALIIFGPQMLAIALAIKLTSKGPVLFTQMRGGRGGVPFKVYKFRTMVVDAEARKQEIIHLNERNGPAFKMKNDPRVTTIGRFLRATSMDELPQFLNVVKGDMSLVGPRPLPVDECTAADQWHRRRLEVKPGLTCIWQVKGRDRSCFDQWVRQDIEYIEKHSLLLDIKLILQTVPAVLSRRGAH